MVLSNLISMSSMHENPMIDSKDDEFDSILHNIDSLFDLVQMAAILDFTNDVMSEVFFDHTTMSACPKTL